MKICGSHPHARHQVHLLRGYIQGSGRGSEGERSAGLLSAPKRKGHKDSVIVLTVRVLLLLISVPFFKR